MKIDFDQISQLAQKFRKDYREDPKGQSVLDSDSRHVFSISFNPECGESRAHVAWPYFRDLVANEASGPVNMTLVGEDIHTLHFDCKIQHTTCVAIMSMYALKQEFELLGLPSESTQIDFDDDIRNLLALWQNLTGWGLDSTSVGGDVKAL